jgi:hypothetical protein
MGGAITLGIRYEEDGQVKQIFMDRWTNDLPWTLVDCSFLDQGKRFREVVDRAKPDNEWPKSIKMDRFKLSEYGYVLVDIVTREIFSENDYFTPGDYHIFSRVSSSREDGINALELLEKNLADFYWRNFSKDKRKQLSREEVIVVAEQLKVDGEFDSPDRACLEILLRPEVFKIDHTSNRPKIKKHAVAWMKARGWDTKSS